jgi:hypothetical protein
LLCCNIVHLGSIPVVLPTAGVSKSAHFFSLNELVVLAMGFHAKKFHIS